MIMSVGTTCLIFGLFLTFGEQMSLWDAYLFVSSLHEPFLVEKKSLYTSKITTFEDAPRFTAKNTLVTVPFTSPLRAVMRL